jgi:hypothetical protein
MMRDRHYTAPAQLVFCNRGADSRLSPLQRPEVSGQFPNLWFAQLFAERWHLAFDSGGDYFTNASIALVEIILIGPFAAHIVSWQWAQFIRNKCRPCAALAVSSGDCVAP